MAVRVVWAWPNRRRMRSGSVSRSTEGGTRIPWAFPDASTIPLTSVANCTPAPLRGRILHEGTRIVIQRRRWCFLRSLRSGSLRGRTLGNGVCVGQKRLGACYLWMMVPTCSPARAALMCSGWRRASMIWNSMSVLEFLRNVRSGRSTMRSSRSRSMSSSTLILS